MHKWNSGVKSAVQKWNRLLDVLVTILKYNKIKIDYEIYIKFLYDGTLSYLTVSTDDVLNTTKNHTAFTELRRVFEEKLRLNPKKDMSSSN